MEVYEPLKDYEEQYFINKLGQIKTIKRKGTDERILKPCILKTGYKAVVLYKNGFGKTFCIHKLLALQYIQNPNNFPVIDHIDRNKLNNNLDNLRWTTYSINSSNINRKGTLCIDKFSKNGKEYAYYKVVIGKYRKRFKIKEEAEKFLNDKKIELNTI